MADTDLMDLEVREGQRRRATKDLLLKKRPVEKKTTLVLTNDLGENEEVELLFRAISSRQYDKLVEKFPPTAEQKKEQMPYDADRFAPALIAATLIDPEMSVEEINDLWSSDTWNRAELMTLFMAALAVCTSAHEVPTIESD